MTRLGLLVGDPEPALARLVGALARHAVVLDGEHPGCDAWLWAPGDPARPPAGARCAVVVAAGAGAQTAATVHVGRGGPPPGVDRWVELPTTGVEHPAARPLAPFTRERLRRARGLAPAVAVGQDGRWTWDGRPLADELVPTALAAATAVVCSGEDVLHALAWGAPTVTDHATADRLGLRRTVEVLTAPSAEARHELARALAGDPLGAAALSAAGRAAYERASPDAAAVRLLAALQAGGPADRLQAALSALGTPSGAAVRGRAARAVPAPPPEEPTVDHLPAALSPERTGLLPGAAPTAATPAAGRGVRTRAKDAVRRAALATLRTELARVDELEQRLAAAEAGLAELRLATADAALEARRRAAAGRGEDGGVRPGGG